MYINEIKKNITKEIKTKFIEIYDDSKLHKHMHNIKKTPTHIKIFIVSDDFINKNFIFRHRMVFSILKKVHKYQIYSITLYTYTLNEWKYKKNNNFNSMQCLQNSKIM